MYLTYELPNQMRIETYDDRPGHYVTCVRCTDGCGACYVALEHESEEDARQEHEACVAPRIDLGLERRV